MEYNIDSLIEFIETGKNVKDKHKREVDSGQERLKFALTQLQGLLASKSIKEYSDSNAFIKEMRKYLLTLVDGKEIDPKALGSIMKAELDSQTKLLEIMFSNKKGSEEGETLIQKINNIQINVNKDDEEKEDSKEISKDNMHLIEKMKLFEDHIKDEIVKAEKEVIVIENKVEDKNDIDVTK